MIPLKGKTHQELAELPFWPYATNLRFSGPRYILLPCEEYVYLFHVPSGEPAYFGKWTELPAFLAADHKALLDRRRQSEELRLQRQRGEEATAEALAKINIDLDL